MSVQSDILDIINDESTHLLPRDVAKPAASTISWVMAAGLIINAAMGVRGRPHEPSLWSIDAFRPDF